MRVFWAIPTSFLLLSSTAWGQDSGDTGGAGEEPVISFGQMMVTAEADQPRVQLGIARENLKMDYELSLQEDFLLRIQKSVENKPF